MKKLIVLILVFVTMGLTVNSCQKDENSNPANGDKLTNKSILTNLLMKVAHTAVAKTTAKDDDDDDDNESICFTITLPVTITTNGQSVTITDPVNYVAVLDALEEVDDDNNNVVFTFPITITLADGSTQTIADTTALQTALDGCHSDDEEDDDIECLSIHYPLTITSYDAVGIAVVMTFNSNSELFAFLETLEDNHSFVINYPATITDANGATIIVHNNNQLESSVEEADHHCGNHHDDGDDEDEDEDDDNGGD